MAELIPWSDRLSVGNPDMDEQHKQLIKLINVLSAAKLQSKDAEYIEKILNELLNYANYHFVAEEALLTRNGCPHVNDHKREHEEFRSWMARSRLRLGDPKSKREVSSQLLNYLKNWLTSHILTSDKKNVYYLRKKAEGA